MELHEFIDDRYRKYALYRIQEQALPDLKDGLALGQRRLLLSARDSGLFGKKKRIKSAALVGYNMGNYHPHGDSALYGTLVNMTRRYLPMSPFKPQGNFGNIADPDSFAHMRYTEVGVADVTHILIRQPSADAEVLGWRPTFDGSKEEPAWLPTILPLCFLNGFQGIAVGVSSTIPMYSVGELVDTILDHLHNGKDMDMAVEDNISAPDFPWGGEVYISENVAQNGSGAYHVYPKITVQGDTVTASEIPPMDVTDAVRSWIRPKLEALGGDFTLNDEVLDVTSSLSVQGKRVPENVDTIVGILRSHLSVKRGASLTFIDGTEVVKGSLAYILSRWLGYALSATSEADLIAGLVALNPYFQPRRTRIMARPYILDSSTPAEAKPVVVYITASGVYKANFEEEQKKVWSPKSPDSLLSVLTVPSTATFKLVDSKGLTTAKTLLSLMSKLSLQDGIHPMDMGGSFLVIPEANPVLIHESGISRNSQVRGGPLHAVKYPKTLIGEKGLEFLVVYEDGRYVLTTKRSFSHTLGGNCRCMISEFVTRPFRIRITSRVTGRSYSYASNLMQVDQIASLPIREAVSSMEVVSK